MQPKYTITARKSSFCIGTESRDVWLLRIAGRRSLSASTGDDHEPHLARPHTTRLDLASGASRTFLLRAGANIVCLSGSLLIDAPRLAENGAPCPPLRLNAGEAQGVGHGGVLRITAIGAAQLVCLNPPGWLVRLGHLLRVGWYC